MDDQTVSAYDEASARYAREWNGQPPPDDMYALLRGHFRPGPTIDVGCGAGRDAAWLRAHGFEAVGVDASEGLLAQARLAPSKRVGSRRLSGRKSLTWARASHRTAGTLAAVAGRIDSTSAAAPSETSEQSERLSGPLT